MNDRAILLNVDDVETERSARNLLLSNAGFVVYDALTRQEILELAEQHRADLVVLRWSDGHTAEICRSLKLQGTDVAVLQIGAPETFSAEADACLTEPMDAAALVAAVRAMLRQRDTERALAESNARIEALQKELRQCDEDFQQFAYSAGHDLKEALRTVTAFLELLNQDAQSRLTPAEKEYVAQVVAGATQMRSLIDDLLAYSRLSRKTQVQGMVGLSAVVSWAIGDLGRQVSEAGATIQVAKGLPKVWGDFAQLGQVIRNLLSNAIKFHKPERPPEVEIGVEESGAQECVIRVRDNGIGIASAYHERIFAPFKRLHGREIPGSGMGLAVCRRIVNLHDGSIWVESEPNQGSTFFLRLPKAARASG